MKKGGFMKDALVLGMITLIAGISLGAVYQITMAPIAAAMERTKQEAYKQVFPDADSFKENADAATDITSSVDKLAEQDFGKVHVDEFVDAVDASGTVLGYVITSTSKEGYGGDVKVSVGIKSDGTTNGIAFLTLGETAGLGMNAAKPAFYEQYSNKKVDSFTVTKKGASKDSEINAISGATITSRAVTGAVDAAIYFAANCISQ